MELNQISSATTQGLEQLFIAFTLHSLLTTTTTLHAYIYTRRHDLLFPCISLYLKRNPPGASFYFPESIIPPARMPGSTYLFASSGSFLLWFYKDWTFCIAPHVSCFSFSPFDFVCLIVFNSRTCIIDSRSPRYPRPYPR